MISGGVYAGDHALRSANVNAPAIRRGRFALRQTEYFSKKRMHFI